MKNSSKTKNYESVQAENENLKTDADKTIVKWRGPSDFFIHCLSSTIGIGNILLFPSEVLEFGGGTFLITYLLMVFILGQPLYYLEILLGQFVSKTNVKAFKALAPGFAGISWSQAIACIVISSYYSAIIAFAVFYFRRSFTAVLPWSKCDKEWGSSCMNSSINGGDDVSFNNYNSSEELFFIKKVLQLQAPDTLEEGFGKPNVEMVINSFVMWLLIFLILNYKNIRLICPLIYVLFCTFVILLSFTRMIIDFKGASTGILYLLKFDWRNLIHPKVLRAAVMQSCFSLTQGVGVIVTYASYNKPNYPAKAMSIGIVLIDVLASVSFAVTNFGVMGNVLSNRNMTIEQIPKHKFEMFLYYLQAFDNIKNSAPAAWVCSSLFFFMICISSIGCLLGLQTVVVNHLMYCFSSLRNWQIYAFCTGICFVLSILFFFPNGVYLIKLVNHFGCDMVIGVLIIFTLLGVCYIYGLQNFCWDIEYMSQRKVTPYWRITWSVLDLCLMCFVMAYTLYAYDPWNGIVFPVTYKVSGYILFSLVILPIPLVLLYTLFKNGSRGCTESARRTFTHENWRPYDSETYEEWKLLKLSAKLKRDLQNDGWIIKYFKTLMRMYD